MSWNRAFASFAIPWLATAAVAGEDPFAIREVPTDGRTVAAEIADLDGDGRTDLLQFSFFGIPTDDRRIIRAYFQRSDGSIPTSADLEAPLPESTAAFDMGDVLIGTGGVELLLLRRNGVAILSFADRQLHSREVSIPDGLTIGAEADERGLDLVTLKSFAFGPEPVLIVPGLGETFLLTLDGELRGRLAVGGRANYFIQPSGLIFSESDIQVFFDAPRISLGDVDGDGRTDVLGSGRHDLRVFLQQPDGKFAGPPDRVLQLGRVTMRDHMRGSGSVRCEGRDIDADGLLDLLISESSGGFDDSRSKTSIYLNNGSGWNLEKPDAVMDKSSALGADQLIDLDGDGRLELLQARVPISILEIVEVFLTRALDVHILAFGLSIGEEEKGFDPDPWFDRKLDVPINFDTSRLRGFIPTMDYDLNGDGYRDFLHSTDGSAIEINLGGRTGAYKRVNATQDFDTEGVLRPGHLDRDDLVDFVLFNPRREGVPIQLLTNRRTLPGTKPTLTAAD